MAQVGPITFGPSGLGTHQVALAVEATTITVPYLVSQFYSGAPSLRELFSLSFTQPTQSPKKYEEHPNQRERHPGAVVNVEDVGERAGLGRGAERAFAAFAAEHLSLAQRADVLQALQLAAEKLAAVPVVPLPFASIPPHFPDSPRRVLSRPCGAHSVCIPSPPRPLSPGPLESRTQPNSFERNF